MTRELVCHPRQPKRLWTIKAYEGLTVDLVPRFGVKPLMCANFRGADINPGAMLTLILDQIDDTVGEEDTKLWLKGVLILLIRIWGYLKKIKGARLYRVVLRKFILLALLVELTSTIIEKLTAFVQQMILSIEELEQLRDLLDCEGVSDEQQLDQATNPDPAAP